MKRTNANHVPFAVPVRNSSAHIFYTTLSATVRP